MIFGKEFLKEKETMHLKIILHPRSLTFGKTRIARPYSLIVSLVNQEVSRDTSPFSNSFETLNKLKELYDSYSQLEVVQFMIKLFNPELKNDDPLALSS